MGICMQTNHKFDDINVKMKNLKLKRKQTFEDLKANYDLEGV